MILPKIISVDDHVLEPGDLWTRALSGPLRERAPRIVRTRGRFEEGARGGWVADDTGEWADIWTFEGYEMAIIPGFAAAGMDQNYLGEHWAPMTYDEMRPGAYEQKARLEDMDANHTDASFAFPTFPRFCGQTFLENADRELGLACVQAYNDWMINNWCAGDGYGRLIPMTLIPLWDPELAAAEVRRCAHKGSFAVAFSENPARLRLPSIHTRHWDPFFAACEETDTVVNLHIGSGVARADVSRCVARARRLADVGSAAAVLAPDDGAQRRSSRMDPVHSRTARQRVGGPTDLRQHRAAHRTAEHLHARSGVRLRLRRRRRAQAARPDRHGSDHVRDRLPPRGLDVANVSRSA